MKPGESVIIMGGGGLLGVPLCRHLADSGYDVTSVSKDTKVPYEGVRNTLVDLSVAGASAAIVAQTKPKAVFYLAALANVDLCEEKPELALRLHKESAAEAARAALEGDARFVYLSTDQLWDGSLAWKQEADPPLPINVYGRTKAEGEAAVMSENPSSLVVRTNFFGVGGSRPSPVDWIINSCKAGRQLTTFADVHFTPISIGILVKYLRALMERDIGGILHVSGATRISKHDFAEKIVSHLGLNANIRKGRVGEANLRAPRPLDMSLNCARAAKYLGEDMPSFDRSLTECFGSSKAHVSS